MASGPAKIEVFMEHKVVNGVKVPLTEADLNQRTAAEAEWEAGATKRATDAVIAKRIKEYGPIGDQLDEIFKGGLDAWRTRIQAVKDANPKPQ
jgi:hypothetical protein